MKYQMTYLSALIYLLNGPMCLALVGEDIFKVHEVDRPNICKLEVKLDPTHVARCTGTLVGKHTIYTAAHCFGRTFDPQINTVAISCGGKNLKSVHVKLPDQSLWLTDRVVKLEADFAVVTTMFNAKADPVQVAAGPDLYFSPQGNMLPGVSCSIFGFGKTDVSGPITAGELIQSNLEHVRVVLTAKETISIYPLEGETSLRTSVAEGDSGGPLICSAQGKNPELVGMILRDQSPDRDLLNTIWSESTLP